MQKKIIICILNITRILINASEENKNKKNLQNCLIEKNLSIETKNIFNPENIINNLQFQNYEDQLIIIIPLFTEIFKKKFDE